MKPLLALLTALLLTPGHLAAQDTKPQVYLVRVFTQTGERFRGVLYEVTDSLVYLRENPNELAEPFGLVIPLAEIEKVVMRKDVKRAPALQGALVGGVGVGFLAVRTVLNRPFRSPVISVMSVLTAVAAGAGTGALVGSAVGRAPRRVVRARHGELDAGRLGGQLRPFAYRNQLDRVYGVP